MFAFRILLFFGLSLNCLCVPCANKFALTNIDAYVRHSSVFSSSRVDRISLGQLETYSFVDVINANASQLCEGMVKGFSLLESLTLINANVSEVHVGAFQDLPKLKMLSLAVNHLKEIHKGAINNIKSLKVLYLSSNEIEFVEEGAFSDMPGLREIHLDKNRISGVDGNLFQGCTSIETVDFSHNLIREISQNAFEDLRPNSPHFLNILLKKNYIRKINGDAFKGLNPVRLELQDNRVIDVSYAMLLNVQENSVLILDRNEVGCVPDEIVDFMSNTTKTLSLLRNSITCECIERIDSLLGFETFGRGRFAYQTIFPCDDIPFS